MEMKLTVLLDNNTFIDKYFLGEPGLSYLIEVDGKKILFDVGYSDASLRNARKLDVDLLDIDYVVLSHGHLDHTWGLVPLIQHFTEGILQKREVKRPTLVAHPAVLSSKKDRTSPEIGSLLSVEKLSAFFDVQFSRELQQLTTRLLFLGEIERTTTFEARKPLGRVVQHGGERDDHLLDDSALVFQSSEGLVIITGCSHSGICNIIEYARTVCGDQPVLDIIGGFHLLDPSREQLQGTIEYLDSVHPRVVHACHCTDLRSKIELSRVVELAEVGVGLVLEF
jgi:7,8-dihydropterin-6-yl-methyl-4-(beta-D-ribofuranosyl)aminobenzene 5'-phosphate synthase